MSSESKCQIAPARVARLKEKSIDVSRVRLNLRQRRVSQVSRQVSRYGEVDIAATCDARTMRADRRRQRPRLPAITLSAAVPQIDQQGRKVAEIAMQILGKEASSSAKLPLSFPLPMS